MTTVVPLALMLLTVTITISLLSIGKITVSPLVRDVIDSSAFSTT